MLNAPTLNSISGRIFGIFQPYWRHILGIIGAILISAILGAIEPLVIQQIFDRALPQHSYTQLTLLALVLCTTPIVTGLVSLGNDYMNVTLGQYILRDLRMSLYQRLQAVSLRFYTTERTGEILSRLTNDVNGIQQVVSETLRTVLSNSMTLLVTLAVMIHMNPLLTMLSLGLIPLFIFLAQRVGKVVQKVQMQKQSVLADITSRMEETLNVSGAMLVRCFGQQSAETKRFGQLNKQLTTVQVRQTMIGRWFLLSLHIFFNLTPVLVYTIGGFQVIGGTLSPGTLIAFVALQGRLFPTIRELLEVHVTIRGSLALFARIFEYLDLPIDTDNHLDAHVSEQIRGHISFRDVHFRYTPACPTLADITFEIQPGQLVALVGPSGAGKTTTTYLLARLYPVEQGTIEIDGHDISRWEPENLNKHIGMVTQETYLLNASVRDNIAYARPDASHDEIIAAAQAAHIHERIQALPEGYDTCVGPRGYLLSGGEKQRIAIARVLLNPRILVLDEATSALDTQSERLIQSALEAARADRTTLVIAHRLSTILAADQILVMKDGSIVESGTHTELLTHGGLYANLYSQQFAQP